MGAWLACWWAGSKRGGELGDLCFSGWEVLTEGGDQVHLLLDLGWGWGVVNWEIGIVCGRGLVATLIE